jgi:3-phenylpropionate/trans-cinnamate dioxygenase ferredoxin reductase subunit
MSTPSNVVIAGAGLAGAKAAQALREEGYDGRIVLLGGEAERPYERPPLSKEYLRGESTAGDVYVHDEGFYDEHSIELRTTTAVASIDVGAATIVTGGGERLPYERLLLATGARPRRLTLPGADLDGVCELRTMADADALRERLTPDARLAIVGAGWIGCEVASSARRMGLEVTVVEPAALPLRVLGPVLGAFYRDLHVEHGVQMVLGQGVTAFEGKGGAVTAVRTADDSRIACDVVVVGVGVVARDEIAQRAGIDTANGVIADEYLQTSVRGVYTAGDVARAYHPLLGRSVRLEHWANALNQGPAAARNMLGARSSYDRLPYVYSDQYDVGMEYTGYADPDDELVIRGDLAAREFIAFWLHEGRVTAGMNVNVWDVTDDIKALIGAGQAVDPASLGDPSIPLGDLLGATAREP